MSRVNWLRFAAAVHVGIFLRLGAGLVLPQDLGVLPPEFFASRRAAALELMPDSSVAVLQTAKVKTRSNDVTYEYRQDSNFYYLTGITDPGSVLVLSKSGVNSDSGRVEELLFVPRRLPRAGAWEKEAFSADEAQRELGFEVVKPASVLPTELNGILNGKKVLFYSSAGIEFLYEPVTNERFFIGQKTKKALRKKHPGLKVKSPSKILAMLRQTKSPRELALLRKAIDITCEAHLEAMRNARPGMYEYELEAIIEYVFKRNGAEYPAFPSIVGSGPNATILHYSQNRRKTERGDLVVMDIGAEYHGYSADVTRTIPISGEFTAKQREIYEIVLRAQNEAIAAVKPGVPFREIHKVAKKVIADAGYGKYFIHGTSHFLGLDTHDVGARDTLAVGMVLTVEPGIYIRETEDIDPGYWNIGVRIEDDVLVTETGHEILSTKAPRRVEEIEKLIREGSRFSAGYP